jgi:hypothetical protein
MIDQTIEELRVQIQSDSLFVAATVVTDRTILETGVDLYEDSLATGLNANGFVIGLRIPNLNVEHPDIPGPVAGMIVLADVWMNPYFAPATMPTMGEIWEHLSGIIHQFKPTLENGAVVVQGNMSVIQDDDLLKMSMPIHLQTVSEVAASQVATPAISKGAADAISASTATSGASMFYTVNGRYPVPVSGTLYSAVVAKVDYQDASEFQIRGYLAGYAPSDLVTVLIAHVERDGNVFWNPSDSGTSVVLTFTIGAVPYSVTLDPGQWVDITVQTVTTGTPSAFVSDDDEWIAFATAYTAGAVSVTATPQ